MTLSTLGVVMPAYNEEVWIATSIQALQRAARTAKWHIDVVVVDDRSVDGTAALLDELQQVGSVRVIHHERNQGRFEARRRGLAELTTTWVLLLDARVILGDGALLAVAQDMREHPDARAWNGHVEPETRGNPFGAFWSALAKIGWHRYFRRPRRVTVTAEHFNAYPKGTGIFLADRAILEGATSSFTSHFDRIELASDDTRLLRNIAERTGFVVLPGFRCTYHGRATLMGWAKQVFYRGTTFVDGYLPGRAGAPVALAVTFIALLGAFWLGCTNPLLFAGGVTAALLIAASAALLCNGSSWEAASIVCLAIPFAVLFGSGIVRGLILTITATSRAE